MGQPEIREALRSLFQEMILPELEQMKAEQAKLGERIDSVDRRLQDINAHMVDQSRQIAETNKRIDSVRDELVGMITETNKRIDRLHGVIVKMNQHMGLQTKVEDLGRRLRELEMRLAA